MIRLVTAAMLSVMWTPKEHLGLLTKEDVKVGCRHHKIKAARTRTRRRTSGAPSPRQRLCPKARF